MSQPTNTILDTILATKREEVAALRARTPMSDLIARCADLPGTRGFGKALMERPPQPPNSGGSKSPDYQGNVKVPENSLPPILGGWGGQPGLSLIAEVKKASPSKGIIRADFDPVAIARAYEAGGAACLSVLTDEPYFQGSLSYLAQIREAVSLPLLRKDFLIDTAQIYEARLAGADAILLIVAAIPSPARLAEMRCVAESLGIDALVEVHDETELAIAVESGAKLIGVNNRDLKTFTLRLEIAETLIPQFPKGTVAVAESGIFTPDDVARMARAGASAVLVGESLMREPHIEAATKRLLGR